MRTEWFPAVSHDTQCVPVLFDDYDTIMNPFFLFFNTQCNIIIKKNYILRKM